MSWICMLGMRIYRAHCTVLTRCRPDAERLLALPTTTLLVHRMRPYTCAAQVAGVEEPRGGCVKPQLKCEEEFDKRQV